MIGNKADLVKDRNTRIAEKFAQLIKADHIITSAATSEGVSTLFKKLAELSNQS